MGLELNDALIEQIKKGVKQDINPIDGGSALPRFEPRALAIILELELTKAAERGLTHIRINMDLKDTAALARFLRRRK